MLFFVNPFGGTGKALSVVQDVVRPLLKQSATASEVIVTERAGHARDFMRTAANLDEYWGVVAVGGDGMLAEVIQASFRHLNKF